MTIEHLLDICLAQLNTGAADLASVLAQYPEQRAELEPMLRVALGLQATPPPTVRPSAFADGRARLEAALAQRQAQSALLDRALAQLERGRAVDDILAELGEPGAAIAPALRAAAAVKTTPLPAPNPTARAAGLARLQEAVDQRRTLEPVLDRALADLRQGQPLDAVLARYPRYASALAPLLRAALAVEQTPQPTPRPQAQAEGMARLLDAVERRREVDSVLDRALADLRAGRADIGMLLARYPEHAAELEPMLLSASLALQAAPTPRPRAQAEGRTRLMEAVSAKRAALVAEKLDVALMRIQRGEAVEAVLASEPAFKAELEPLVVAALAVQRTPEPVAAPQAREAGEQRLTRAAQSRQRAAQGLLAPLWAMVAAFSGPRGHMRRAFIATMALLFFVGTSLAGVTRAAAYSLPDDALYPVKLATEQVQIALAASPAARAQLHMAFAQERLREVQAATAAGRDPQRALIELSRHTETVRDLLDQLPATQRSVFEPQFEAVQQQEQTVIRAVKQQLPVGARELAEKIVTTPTPAGVAASRPAATATARPQDTATPAPTIPAPQAASVEVVQVSPSKTPLPAAPTATIVVQPVQPVVIATQPPVIATQPAARPTSAPVVASTATAAPAPTDSPAPTATARPLIISSGSRSATATPVPPPTQAPLPTSEPAVTVAPSPPTKTPLPPPPPTNTPAPAVTLVVPPTRAPYQTPTPRPPATAVPEPPTPAPTSAPPTSVPPTSVPPTSVPPTSAPPQATSPPPASTPRP